MASSSSKKTAASNAQTLKELHSISLAINFACLLGLYVLHRPSSKWKYFFFSIPSFVCQFIIEKSGRPVYAKEAGSGVSRLVRSGNDIKGPGLFEYMFDCIYITWICDVLMLLFGSNKVWMLFLAVPGFIAYKVLSLAKSFFGNRSATTPVAQEAAPTQGKSKRQTKLEQRGQKQKFRTR
ncbi:hypothetical protein FOB63_002953 [Clavispora lusitaniae]|uniref:Uncharacterized protein n=1 Tax=Clavispora lusitaniae (strain ATCC 42720) TaxID=306902 RepID=C4Y520_CLAL4|nr:uncharacterized protein CLUG_03254 [Clavispora lusitaniae ATCC 42720]EEQ39126.1 hypothetical protein CLUG_03254 [Clavispora lusitaniae ATCC 42720]KAF5210061.1 hypothetical protein E0198_002920 [Clavispora lusitaniae]KAF7582872.1 hypothetical protein FOB63_002953 [Clavispora lusitaniae]